MNRRERLLVILVATAAGLAVVRLVVEKYRDSLSYYDQQMVRLRGDLDKIQFEQTMAQMGSVQWREIGAETLSMDVNEAMTRLREEMSKLTEKTGLREVGVVLESTPKRWQNNGVKTLNFTVTGQGKLDDVVRFLFELHRQPFAVRVKTLVLDLAAKPTPRSEVRPEQRGLLKMTATLDTLILPANALVRQIEPAVLDPVKRKSVPRPAFAAIADYKSLLDKKLFQPYEAPQVVIKPPPPPPPPGPGTRPAGPGPPPPPPPPPADAQMVLGRLLSSPRGQLAVLENPARRGEDEYKEVGDAMYGGTLVYVHPSGAVTEMDGQLRFHAIGEALQSCKVLTEQDQPIVHHEVLKLREQATGISRGAGDSH
ncbi:MAG TPA: hypothetical protein VLM89_01970 [Phycisphaerae bacterium]|nr:hypothetical protein [Phycisphaerae bacterium]